MRKEVLAAIITGIVLGVVVAFGIWRANVAFQPTTQGVQTESQSPTPKEESENSGITIAKPEQNQVVSESPILVSGITKANSWVVISTDDKDYVLKTQANGEFEQEVDLVGGVNQIVFSAFSQQGEKSSSSLLLVYSTEFEFPEEPTPTPEEENQEGEDSVGEKIQEKISQARRLPLAYLGTITDISDTSLQVRILSGEIGQVTVAEGADLVKVNDDSESIEFSDLAIGDFIVAMGFKGENEVLITSRLLVTDPVDAPSIQVLLGEVLEINTNELMLKPDSGEELTVDIPRQREILTYEDEEVTELELSDIAEGATIIVSGTESEGGIEARTILVVTQPHPEETETPTPEE